MSYATDTLAYMTDVYVALYVEPGDHHRLIGTFDSWDSLTSHLSTDYATWMQGGPYTGSPYSFTL